MRVSRYVINQCQKTIRLGSTPTSGVLKQGTFLNQGLYLGTASKSTAASLLQYGNVLHDEALTQGQAQRMEISPLCMETFDVWHDIIKTQDHATGAERLRGYVDDNVVFYPPTYFKPWRGKEEFLTLISTVGEVFGESFQYHRQWLSPCGSDWALEFECQIHDDKEKQLNLTEREQCIFEGIDLVKLDPATGKIVEFKVMGRPPNAVNKLAKIMLHKAGPKLAKLKVRQGIQSLNPFKTKA